jgi:hypothetical protein
MHERLITHTDVTAFIPGEPEEATPLCPPSSEYYESAENERMLELHADQLSQRYGYYERASLSLHDAEQTGDTRNINVSLENYRLARTILHETVGRTIIAERADFDSLVRNDEQLRSLENVA